MKSGASIHGGLLDRCEINLFAEALEIAQNGLDYLSKTVAFSNSLSTITFSNTIQLCATPEEAHERQSETRTSISNCFFNNPLYSSVSSDPVQVAFCDPQDSVIYVRKGASFRVHIKAMDQVGTPVNATIHSSVITKSGVGHLKEGQEEQRVGNQCTELEYNVFSQDNTCQVQLYAEGPCSNLGISEKVIAVNFLPCTCAVGLVVSQSPIDCECVCSPELQLQKVTKCSQLAASVQLERDIWIGITNSSNDIGYIIHDCPFDYCVQKPVNISLNSSDQRDRQCAFNRSGVLCGKCQNGLSLVLATSKCKKCSNLHLLLLIPFAMLGIMLVGFILFFNITMATGTIHGLIFYANVLAASKAIFLPYTTPNFLTVFISWVNLGSTPGRFFADRTPCEM